MTHLVLAVCCSLGIGMILKHAGQAGLDRMALLTTNYAAATLVGGVLMSGELGRPGGGLPEAGAVGLGVLLGALLIAAFFAYARATEAAGLALAVGVMRVSVVVPVLASWLVWGDALSAWDGLGLVLAGGAFFMVAHRPARPGTAPVVPSEGSTPGVSERSGEEALAFGALLLLFVVSGLADVAAKAFEEHYAGGVSKPVFLLTAFGAAFLLGLASVARRGARGVHVEARTLGWGALLGVANYGSLEFLLRAIDRLSGTFVFPANSVAIVLGGALLGVFFWGERLSRLNLAGLGLAAGALVLLGV